MEAEVFCASLFYLTVKKESSYTLGNLAISVRPMAFCLHFTMDLALSIFHTNSTSHNVLNTLSA